MQARKYVIRGRVQGVGFRWFVEREASALGLKGWVRNREDSSVELLAAGDAANLELLKVRLKQGPRASRVDEVEECDAGPEETAGNLQSFEIRSF